MANLEDLCLSGHVVSSGATWCCNLPKAHPGPHDDGLGDQWEDAAQDVVAVAQTFLQQCGSCDAGLPMECSHPNEDYRPVMARLVGEVERLRAEALAGVDAKRRILDRYEAAGRELGERKAAYRQQFGREGEFWHMAGELEGIRHVLRVLDVPIADQPSLREDAP